MQRLLIVALTVLVFGAGYGVRFWIERDRPLPPPPPEGLGSEFARPPAVAPANAKDAKRGKGVNRASLAADIEKARPNIDAYRKRLTELDAEFDRGIMAILTDEQREKYVARQKRDEERRTKQEAREAADTSPLSDARILQLQQIPLFNVLWSVSITPRLARLNRDLKLDELQQAKARDLLLTRRDQFLALVDSLPPPTVSLSLLASRAERLGELPADK
jgi:hypothetical protein